MVTTQTTMAVGVYLGRVRAELVDLPATELGEVMDEVAGHLDEFARELPAVPTLEQLEERLGSAQEYADQLRGAAGYPPRPDAFGPTSRGTAALVWLALSTILTPFLLIFWFWYDFESSRVVFVLLAVGLIPAALGIWALRGNDPSVVTGTPIWRRGERGLQRTAAMLPSYLRGELVAIGQPTWWVLRGALAGVSLYGVLVRSTDAPPLLVAAIAGALISIWLGRKSQRNRYWLWLLVPMNSVAVLAVAILLIGGTGAWGYNGYNFSGVHYNV